LLLVTASTKDSAPVSTLQLTALNAHCKCRAANITRVVPNSALMLRPLEVQVSRYPPGKEAWRRTSVLYLEAAQLTIHILILFPHLSPLPAYSNPTINLLLTPVLTTPPTPNAGTILATLAKQLFPQSLHTLSALLPHITPLPPPGLLYISSASKCSGVLTTCKAAGARNCAIDARLITRSISSPTGNKGARTGGRLNDAKIVRQSRSANKA